MITSPYMQAGASPHGLLYAWKENSMRRTTNTSIDGPGASSHASCKPGSSSTSGEEEGAHSPASCCSRLEKSPLHRKSHAEMIVHAKHVSDTEKIPALEELQARSQRVCWRGERRKGKLTKVPSNPHTGTFAHTDKPQTCSGYAQAKADCEKQPWRYDGLGFMFERDYTGIDLDHCVNPDGGLDAWAQAYLDRLKSYAEYSPSRTGVHILIRGTILSRLRRHVPHAPHTQAAIEMYCEGRYFTITGQHVAGTPPTIEECPTLQAVYAGLNAPNQKPRAGIDVHNLTAGGVANSDDTLLDKAMSAKNGATFRALWQGDTSGYASQSEAELALCLHLYHPRTTRRRVMT
jgi:putative DNA primase/helicase